MVTFDGNNTSEHFRSNSLHFHTIRNASELVYILKDKLKCKELIHEQQQGK